MGEWTHDERGAVHQLDDVIIVLEAGAHTVIPGGLPECQAVTLAWVEADPEAWVDRARAFLAEHGFVVARDVLGSVELRIPADGPLLALVADWADDPEQGIAVVWWHGRPHRWGGRSVGDLWGGPRFDPATPTLRRS